MDIYEFAKALIAEFPATFDHDTEFTFNPEEPSLECLGTKGPDITIYFYYKDVVVNMEFVGNEECMDWMDKCGSKEFRRIEAFVLETYKAHEEILDDEEMTFHFGQ